MSERKVRYKVLEDIAIADFAFEAYGKDLGELFENAAMATEDVMVDVNTVKPNIECRIDLSSEKIDDLLYKFLSEIVYYKDAEALLFSYCRAKVEKKGNKWNLSSLLKGDKLKLGKQELRTDVKAVTLHMFEVKETKEGWKCRVVLDI